MEIIKFVALTVAVLLIFSACSSHNDSFLSYQNDSFRAHLSWQVGKECFSARLSSVLDNGGRIISIEFTAPDGLDGICVRKAGESVSASLGTLKIDSAAASHLLEIYDFFNINAALGKSSVERIDGSEFNRVEAVVQDGTAYTLYLFPDSGLPRRICGSLGASPCTLDVLAFEIIPQ